MIKMLRRWILKRRFVQEEIAPLRREISVLRTHSEIAEHVIQQKQLKINRLLLAFERAVVHPAAVKSSGLLESDLRPEKVIATIPDMIARMSSDFDDRQRVYEQTGWRDRQERALTEAPPAKEDRPPDESA